MRDGERDERHGEILRDVEEDGEGGESGDKRWGERWINTANWSETGERVPVWEEVLKPESLKTQKADWGLSKVYLGVRGTGRAKSHQASLKPRGRRVINRWADFL